MPFYIRKSITIGPFRLNLSKSGLGVSGGVKGYRIGTGPRGHYIHAGANGVYYRKTLGGVGAQRKPIVQAEDQFSSDVSAVAVRDKLPTYITEDGVLMQRILSSDAELLVTETHSEALASLNEARSRPSMTALLAIPSGVLLAIALLFGEPLGVSAASLLLAACWFCGSRLDASRRNVIFAYDLDADAETRYRALVEAIDALGLSAHLHYVKAAGDITNLHAWKKNAGASRLLDTGKTTVAYVMPPGVASNVTPPMLNLDGQLCYFFPDCVLIHKEKSYGAVRYEDLRTDVRDQRMIVDSAPSDSQIVGETWKYVNKNGSPDRRFKDNRRLPICLFEEIGMVSGRGFKGLLQISRRSVAHPVREAIHQIGSISQEIPDAPPLLITYD